MPNILICDDDKDIVNALKIYLSDPDYTLYEAFNGREALTELQKGSMQVVIDGDLFKVTLSFPIL